MTWWPGGCTSTSPGALSRCFAPPPPPHFHLYHHYLNLHHSLLQVLISELTRLVAAWHDTIGPKLESVELRKAFDIHAYGGCSTHTCISTSTSTQDCVKQLIVAVNKMDSTRWSPPSPPYNQAR